jgi:hypothetical protein
MGIEGYMPAIPFSNTPEKQGFSVLKRKHKMKTIQKRGFVNAH